MSEKPHSVAIGAFIVGALLILVTAILFVVGSGFSTREKIVMVFDGSVKGLNIGAPLALRGVQVGQVTSIDVVLNTDKLDFFMVVEADLYTDSIKRVGTTTDDVTEELIERGLRAQLNTQSILTGLLYIQLDFHPDSKLKLRNIDSPYTQFPTVPTELQRIARKLQEMDFDGLVNNTESALQGMNSFLNNEALQNLPTDLQATLASLTALSDQLQAQLANTVPKVDKVLDGAAVTVATANAELPQLSERVMLSLATLNQAAAAFEKAMLEIDGLASPDSATSYQLNQALREITLAARALQLLAKTLDEQPEALIRGKSGDKQ
jgi:phospholipid/cholesterol/gamma-HCH transport system substrate-binding protein